MLSAKSVGDRAKQLNVVLRREITKIGSFEAEQAQAHKTTIFSEVSMTDFKPSRGSHNGATVLHQTQQFLFRGLFVFLWVKTTLSSPLHLSPNLLDLNLRLDEPLLENVEI